MSMRVFLCCALLTGCAASEHSSSRQSVYWDQPITGWYWVADGVEPAAIIKAAGQCGAKVDGSTANHGVVPPGFSTTVFHFVGNNDAAARNCMVKQLNAVPQLTTYLK